MKCYQNKQICCESETTTRVINSANVNKDILHDY